jgi:hypothetical protein
MLGMWLATVFVLTDSSCAIRWLLLPLAIRVKISSSRGVRAARIATAELSLVLTGEVELADVLQEPPENL